MDNIEDNANKQIATSRFDMVFIICTFLIAGLMFYLAAEPVIKFIMRFWFDPNVLFDAKWQILQSQQRYYGEIFTKGSHTDILVLLAGLATFAIKFLNGLVAVVVAILSFLLILPPMLATLAILGAPQILVFWAWRRMRNAPKP